jgi:hypothetical protein
MMLDPESGELQRGIEQGRTDETWNLRWAVLIIFLLEWFVWFLRISKHWEMWNHVSAIGLLSLSPAPCVLMFFRREAYSPGAALITYALVSLAFGVAIG